MLGASSFSQPAKTAAFRTLQRLNVAVLTRLQPESSVTPYLKNVPNKLIKGKQ
jgi:hypothetical protein